MNRRLTIILAAMVASAVIAILIINLRVTSWADGRLYDSVEATPSGYAVAIVPGARVGKNDEPSNTLYDRTLTAAELYKAGKVEKLLLSGGGREPEVMKKVAIELGVDGSDITLDDQGLRTYDTCARARQVFNVEKAVIVTQDYHLARSVYLCRNMGIDAVGVNAKRREYEGERWLWVREYLSRVAALYDINFRDLPPAPQQTSP